MRLDRLLLVPALLLIGLAAAPGAAAIPGYQACEPGNNYRLDVRGVSCEYAAQVASSYEFEGDKYQTIFEYQCYSAQADVYPIVLTCVSGDSEVVVSEV